MKCAVMDRPLAQESVLLDFLDKANARLRRRDPRLNQLCLQAQSDWRRGRYASALANFGRAIRSAPSDPVLYARRSDLFVQINRPAQALRDIERAMAILPDSEWLQLARLRLLVYCGRNREAAAEISRLIRREEGAACEALFYRGCLRLKQGLWRQAAEDFHRAMDSHPEGDILSLRSRFYWLAARMRDPRFLGRFRRDADRPKGPRLYLCGLGILPPYTATFDILNAILQCDVVVNNLYGSQSREFLSMFCPEVRPAEVGLRNRGDDAYWARHIIGLLREGHIVGYATRGHPMLISRLVDRLRAWCQNNKVDCVAYGAVSSLDVLLARTGQENGAGIGGVQLCVRKALTDGSVRIDTAQPLIVIDPEDLNAEAVGRLRAALARSYPLTHDCCMFGPFYEMEPARFRLGDMARRFPEIRTLMTLYVPPIHARG